MKNYIIISLLLISSACGRKVPEGYAEVTFNIGNPDAPTSPHSASSCILSSNFVLEVAAQGKPNQYIALTSTVFDPFNISSGQQFSAKGSGIVPLGVPLTLTVLGGSDDTCSLINSTYAIYGQFNVASLVNGGSINLGSSSNDLAISHFAVKGTNGNSLSDDRPFVAYTGQKDMVTGDDVWLKDKLSGVVLYSRTLAGTTVTGLRGTFPSRSYYVDYYDLTSHYCGEVTTLAVNASVPQISYRNNGTSKCF